MEKFQQAIRKALHTLNSFCWALLLCSLLFNYGLWTGRIIRPEWVQDYVSSLQESMHNLPPSKHQEKP